jgi:hypothetical protein
VPIMWISYCLMGWRSRLRGEPSISDIKNWCCGWNAPTHRRMAKTEQLTLYSSQEIGVYLHSVSGTLLGTSNGGSAFSSKNHCQGQLKTPQSVTILMSLAPISRICSSWCGI